MNETTVAQAKQAAETHYYTLERHLLMFNNHAYIKRMTACGFNEKQAEGLAAEQGDLLNNLATRVDVDNINTSFEKVYLRFDEVDKRFEEVDQRFDEVDRRFEEVDQRFDEVDRRFEKVDKRFDEIDRRFEKVDQRFDVIDRRFEKVEQSIDTLRQEIGDIRSNMATKQELDNAISNAKTEIIKWLAAQFVGQIIAISGITFTILKFAL